MVHDNVLTITGEWKYQKDETNKKFHRIERLVQSLLTNTYLYCPALPRNRARKHMSIHVGANNIGANNIGGKSMRSQRFSVCGLLLVVALLGGCAIEAPKPGNGKRVGGQAGMEEHLEKGSVVPDSPGERIGGQSGLEKPLEKGTVIPSNAGERVGGQAGQEPPLEK